MKVILLKNVPKVGSRYDTKDVSDGYALNYMIPNGLAEVATPQAVAKANIAKQGAEREKKVQEELLSKNLDELANVKIEIKEKVNDKGHLFKGIHKEELAKLLKEQTRLDFDPSHIILEKPIKAVGEHVISVVVGGKEATFKVSISAI